MKKTIGCLHAHYSNIEHIENALDAYDTELIHYVDPGFDRRIGDASFSGDVAERKVAESLDWIVKSGVDAVLITCTFFAAAYREEVHPFPVPVIRINDPLFLDICRLDSPFIFVFTNPATVEGTMNQFARYSRKAGKDTNAEARLLPDVFELIMRGEKEAYLDAVSKGLMQMAEANPAHRVIAAQLSMAPAARLSEAASGIRVGDPLDSLAGYMKDALFLRKKPEKDAPA